MKFQKGSIRRSLRFSIWDGLFASMMMGVSESYLIPYAIALGATSSQVAFLASLPALVGAILQIKSAAVTQSIGSRMKLINGMVFFHALAWLPIIFIPYLFRGVPLDSWRVWALLLAAILFASFGAFSVPAWQSLMSDYIPVKKRGKYFGWRNRLQGIAMTLVSVGAGFCLNYFGKNRMIGFTIIFTFAMFCRFCSFLCLVPMKEPFRHTSHDVYFSFFDFLGRIRTSNFARFVLFVSFMNFSVSLSAPLLSVYLLRDLGFNYVYYMAVITTATLGTFLFQGFWGHYGDRHGNFRVLKIAGWGIAVIPVFWLFSHNLFYLIGVQLFAGCVWGGFTLLFTNFMMEAVKPEKRIRCISYFNVTNSVFVLLGALAGAILVRFLPQLFGYAYLTLFLVSGLGRAAAMEFGRRFVREVREQTL